MYTQSLILKVYLKKIITLFGGPNANDMLTVKNKSSVCDCNWYRLQILPSLKQGHLI